MQSELLRQSEMAACWYRHNSAAACHGGGVWRQKEADASTVWGGKGEKVPRGMAVGTTVAVLCLQAYARRSLSRQLHVFSELQATHWCGAVLCSCPGCAGSSCASPSLIRLITYLQETRLLWIGSCKTALLTQAAFLWPGSRRMTTPCLTPSREGSKKQSH